MTQKKWVLVNSSCSSVFPSRTARELSGPLECAQVGATTGAPGLHLDARLSSSDSGPCLAGLWLLSILSPPRPGLGSVDLTDFTSISQKTFPWRASGYVSPSGRAGPRGGRACVHLSCVFQRHLTCIPQPLALQLVTSPPNNHGDGRCVMEAQSGANTHCSRRFGPDAALCAPVRRKPTSDARAGRSHCRPLV